MKVTEILDAAEMSQACERVLGTLPDLEIHGLWDEGNPCLILVKRL